MKRILALLLAVMMLLSVVSCSSIFNNQEEESTKDDSTTKIEQTTKAEDDEDEDEENEETSTSATTTEELTTEAPTSEVTETTEPSTTEELTTEPEATEPEATEPEATEPEVTEPEVTEPEVTEPEATEPEATEPEITEPEVTEPEVTEPEVTEPEATEPEVTEPEATEPEVTEPEITEPEVSEPETTEPEVTEPEVIEPEVTEPEATEPEVTEPEVTEPEVTEPEVTEPEVTEPEKEKFVYKHVIIVGIDGMGAYHKNANTPNMDRIFADYALTDVAETYDPVASGPCWLSMFTGVDPKVMRVTKNPEYAPEKWYTQAVEKYPTLFELIHTQYPETSTVASISRWTKFQELVCPQDYIYTAGEPVHWTTAEEKNNALAYIEQMDPDQRNFAYFYFAEPDSTGHKKEWGSADFNAALSECDAALGEIFDAIEAKGILDDTLFIMATDHGGEGTQHGYVFTDNAIKITLGFRGKTINNIKDFDMIFRDIAPIVTEAMGVAPSNMWAGLKNPPKVPEGLFKDE